MRELNWQPSASIQNLQQRAQLLIQIRKFFNSRGYLEVETPVMGHYGITDLYLSNVTAHCQAQTTYLQTSPEYHMKRLLAAGSGPIFQLARVFRNDELGRWHNPEFTLLEWYQLDIDNHSLMVEVGEFLQELLHCEPLLKKTYQEVFLTFCALDPFVASISELQEVLRRYNLEPVLSVDETDRDQYLFLLMSHVIEPALISENRPVAVYDFPESQAALAQINKGRAARFEVYYRGVELANGFHELTDGALQQQRFEVDSEKRRQKGLPSVEIDPLFLSALSVGLPECSGVALGLDRLIALALGQTSISDVVAFDWGRA
ncbi:MAG: EF-P lysine aminoacylase GenX [Legionellales bacterium RIFCSPHIGHO2_12_FULL_42_9]|nr:MAG: EF-P lysine aminoacylase GenX [Legionellales bacterium RIFCSPHIGHO2_12_FULL_42_9]